MKPSGGFAKSFKALGLPEVPIGFVKPIEAPGFCKTPGALFGPQMEPLVTLLTNFWSLAEPKEALLSPFPMPQGLYKAPWSPWGLTKLHGFCKAREALYDSQTNEVTSPSGEVTNHFGYSCWSVERIYKTLWRTRALWSTWKYWAFTKPFETPRPLFRPQTKTSGHMTDHFLSL